MVYNFRSEILPRASWVAPEATRKERVAAHRPGPKGRRKANRPMNKFHVCGGQFRSSVFQKLEEWESCKRAMLVEIDPTTKTSRNRLEYESPREVTADELPAVLFKYVSAIGNKLYTCTSTEVIIFDLPSFRVATYISLPIFNDLHHVYLSSRRGTLLVAVTGLDIVAEVSLEGKFLRHWDVLGADTWSVYSKDIDYRKVPTTKPHRAHVNHVFELGDEIWATRSHQRDAVSLEDPTRRIEIAIQRPHEGFLHNDLLYFTTVDGHIVIVNPRTLAIERIDDLNKMSTPGDEPLGFCRGLLLEDERFAWVGFTRIRPTKFRENVSWVRHPTRTRRHSHVALYDLQSGTCLEDIETEPHGIGVISNVLQIPDGD
jgi:hypothetical protein